MVKSMVKKVIFILFVFIIFSVTIKFTKTFAANYQGYEYEVNNDNSSITITGYSANDTSLEIPTNIAIGTKMYEVTSIGKKAFYGNKNLLKVRIPDSIKKIETDAFENCSSKLKIYATANSEALSYAKSNNIKYLVTFDNWAYSINNASSITLEEYVGTNSNISIPNQIDGKTINQIAKRAFYSNKNLQEVILPETIIEIGQEAFKSCINLREVSMPNSIIRMGSSVFAGCNNLTAITISENLTTISDRTFYMCTSLNTITIPENVKKIGESAFDGCTSLSSITIPKNVSKLENGIFNNCNKNNLKIYCKSGSNASKYAKTNNINFILLDAPRKLSVIQKPDKLKYVEGDNFDKQGMLVQVTYNDGTIKNINNYEVLDGKDLRVDRNVITISYTESEVTVKLKCALDVTLAGQTEENNIYEEEIKEEPKITLNRDVGTLDINGTLKFIATITPLEISSQKIIWTSSNEEIVSINNNGVVKGKQIGSTTITAKTEDGKCETSCEVMVVSIPEDYQGPIITIEVIEEADDFAKVRVSVTDRENPIKNLMINDINCTKNLNEYNEIETKIYKNVDYEIITKDANGNISTFIYNYNNTNGEIVTCENGEILREIANGEGLDEDVYIEPEKSEIVNTTPSFFNNIDNIIIILIIVVITLAICVHMGVKIRNMRKI